MVVRSISYGGGVQSTAMLVLAAQGRLDFPLALFSNVGDDSEHPATLDYVRNIAMPYGEKHGIEVVELNRRKRDGAVETLYGRITREGSLSEPIPVMLSGGNRGSRSCTADFKLQVIGKELRRRGATEETPAVVAVGISMDEMQRAHNKQSKPYEQIVYPLLDLRLRRNDCMTIIEDAGLPVPPKSSCYFCPFHQPTVWADMARDEPELFQRAAGLERLMTARAVSRGRGPVYFTRLQGPLDEVIRPGQELLPLFTDEDGGCDNGACWT